MGFSADPIGDGSYGTLLQGFDNTVNSIDVNSGPTTNTFDVTVTDPTNATSGTAADPTTAPNQNGIAASSGTSTVSTDATLLNEDTSIFGSFASDMLTGAIRAGNFILSTTSEIISGIGSAASAVVDAIGSGISWVVDSVASVFTGGSTATYIPADPLVLDLNGDGVQLTS